MPHRSGETLGAPREGAPEQALPDEEVVRRVLSGETPLYEMIMRRHNQRLFRAVRALVSDDSEAEDILQDAYVRAYEHLDQFEGRSSFATWLTRIAIHEALARKRRLSRFVELPDEEARTGPIAAIVSDRPSPEDAASSGELRAVLDRSLEEMPESLRLVFVLREVEGLSTEETAECLDISVANAKVRLHRARALLQSRIDRRLGAEVRKLHQFAGARCDRIVAAVLSRIAQDGRPGGA